MGVLKAKVGADWVPVGVGAGPIVTPMQARLWTVSTVTLTTAVTRTVPFDGEEFDSSGMHSNTVNPSRLTVPPGGGGLWLFGYALSISNSPVGGSRGVMLRVNNGNHNLANSETPNGNTTAHTGHVGSVILQLSDGDYVEVFVYQNSGSSSVFLYGYADPRQSPNTFWATRLGNSG